MSSTDDRTAAEIYKKYHSGLFRTAYRILGNREDSEDAVQETLVKFILGRVETAGENQTWAWMRKTCARKAIDILRRRKRHVFTEDTHDNNEDYGFSDCSLDRTHIPEVMETLMSMKDGYRSIISLHLIEGYDYEEISAITGLSETGVRSRYMRARQKLALLLAEKGYTIKTQK